MNTFLDVSTFGSGCGALQEAGGWQVQHEHQVRRLQQEPEAVLKQLSSTIPIVVNTIPFLPSL